MSKKLLILGVLIALFFAGSVGVSNQYYYANQKKSVEEYTKLAGEYVKNNPELLSKSIDALENKLNTEDVVANVDLLSVSIGEIEFRKGLRRVTGVGDSSDKAVFNTLVEEKLIISYAIKNNILPSKSEINTFIESERSMYQQDAKAKKFVDDFCTAANMTIEDYWRTYEFYNAFRILTLKKAFDHSIESGIKNGEIRTSKDGTNLEINREYEDYWAKVKKEMKDKTSITINKKYRERDFVLDNSKLYI